MSPVLCPQHERAQRGAPVRGAFLQCHQVRGDSADRGAAAGAARGQDTHPSHRECPGLPLPWESELPWGTAWGAAKGVQEQCSAHREWAGDAVGSVALLAREGIFWVGSCLLGVTQLGCWCSLRAFPCFSWLLFPLGSTTLLTQLKNGWERRITEKLFKKKSFTEGESQILLGCALLFFQCISPGLVETGFAFKLHDNDPERAAATYESIRVGLGGMETEGSGSDYN